MRRRCVQTWWCSIDVVAGMTLAMAADLPSAERTMAAVVVKEHLCMSVCLCVGSNKKSKKKKEGQQ
jgi:hypothetical protein